MREKAWHRSAARHTGDGHAGRRTGRVSHPSHPMVGEAGWETHGFMKGAEERATSVGLLRDPQPRRLTTGLGIFGSVGRSGPHGCRVPEGGLRDSRSYRAAEL